MWGGGGGAGERRRRVEGEDKTMTLKRLSRLCSHSITTNYKTKWPVAECFGSQNRKD